VVEAEVEARRVAERDGAVYCSPYNDLKVLTGGLLTHGIPAISCARIWQSAEAMHNI
jgi:hypothetical protein